jgi:hypothetical protein
MNWQNRLPSDIDGLLLKNATRVRAEFWKYDGQLGATFKVSGSIDANTDDDGEVTVPAGLRPMFELLERFQKQEQ